MRAKLQAFHVQCKRRGSFLSIGQNDFIPIVIVSSKSGQDNIRGIVRIRRLGLFGDAARLDRELPGFSIFTAICNSRDSHHHCATWRCLPGRPRITWLHQVRDDTGLCLSDACSCASDRTESRAVATTARLRVSE